jgi:leucyl-tRNA synthetase
VNDDLGRFHMNTAIAALMEMTNVLSLTVQDAAFRPMPTNADGAVLRDAAERLLLLLAPMAPFLCEEAWERLGHGKTIFSQPIPVHDPEAVTVDTVTVVVQVGGKVRGRLDIPVGASEDAVRALALADENVTRHLGGKPPRKVIYVPGKVLNLVAG